MTNTELSGGDAVLRVAVLEQQVAALEAEKARGFLPDGYVMVPVEPLMGLMSHNDHDTRVQAERHLLAALDTDPAPAERVEQQAVPSGWVPLLIEYDPGYPEEVAFGPQRMMDRLKLWLDKYFAMLAAAPQADSSPLLAKLDISGIGRDAGHPRAVLLYLRHEPSDDDLRTIQEMFRTAYPAPAPAERVSQNDWPKCDYCGEVPDCHPWHGSGMFNLVDSPHIHACTDCRHLLPTPAAPDVAGLLNRIVPRIDAGGPNPIDPALHCCEWTLHKERDRIHNEFADALSTFHREG